MPLPVAIILSSLFVLSSCNLYFSDDDDCDEWGQGSGFAGEFRDAESGLCLRVIAPCSGPSCGECRDTLGNTPTDSLEVPIQAACENFCTGLDETSCLATSACRGIYSASQSSSGGPDFRECWATAGDGSARFDECNGLDAFSCSTSDKCAALHEHSCPLFDEPGLGAPQDPQCAVANFVSCHNERATPVGECFSDDQCNSFEVCNAAEVCLPPPYGTPGEAQDSVCYGYCEAQPPMQCRDDSDCGDTNLFCSGIETCPEETPGTDVDCIGTCTPAPTIATCHGEVACDELPPLCEQFGTPAISNGCYTGDCIAIWQCPDGSCSEMEEEWMCVAKSGCSPLYVGEECDCSPDGCICEGWNYESCTE